MLRADGAAGGVEIVGQLSILADDEPLEIEFRGSVIVLALPDLTTALRLRRKLSRGERRLWTRRLQSTMAGTGLELQVWIKRRQIGWLAASSRGGWLATCFGVAPIELNIGALLATVASSAASPRSQS